MAAMIVAGTVIAALAATDVGPFSEAAPPPASLRERQQERPVQEQEKGRPWLGVLLTDRPRGEGVTVVLVFADSPADDANLEGGDVVTALNGQTVETARDLREALEDKQVGDKITLSVIKGGEGEASNVELTLAAVPEPLRVRGRPLFPPFAFDDKGEELSVAIVSGTVKRVTDTELVLALKNGQEKTFPITAETHILRRQVLAEGQEVQVLVVSVKGEARLVAVLPQGLPDEDVGAFHPHRHPHLFQAH